MVVVYKLNTMRLGKQRVARHKSHVLLCGELISAPVLPWELESRPGIHRDFGDSESLTLGPWMQSSLLNIFLCL